MNDLYICHTPYHLLISVIKVLNSKNKAELILCNDALIDEYTLKKIREENLFSEITAYTDLDSHIKDISYNVPVIFRRSVWKGKIKRIIDISKLKHRNIYIFNDSSFIGLSLNIYRIRYNLVEDGLNCFGNNVYKSYVSRSKGIRRLIKIVLGIENDCFGHSIYTRSIEVNDVSIVKINNKRIKKKLLEVSRKKLFASITSEQKETIVNMFLPKQQVDYYKNICSSGECSLLVTQPLSEDFIMDENNKIKLYKTLIKEYAIGKVFIKPHPREKNIYEEYFPECHIIKDSLMPLEILSFIDGIKFKCVITAFSTAIDNITFCDEKVSMGVEWAEKFR